MSDSIILSSFGVYVGPIVEEQILDEDSSSITIQIKLDKGDQLCKFCGSMNSLRIKDYKYKKYSFVNPNGKTLFVIFKQRRYVCCECGKTFLENNPFISNGKYKLSQQKILLILEKLKESFLSVKYIAKTVGVSDQSVFNVMEDYVHFDRRTLPEFLSIDEYKGSNKDQGVGKYPCLLLNTITHKPIDVIRSRRIDWLNDYFSKITFEERNRVKYVVIDMYEPYKTLMARFFPNAIVAIDPFHYVRYVTEAMDSTRLDVQRSFNEESKEYKALQKNRDLLRRKDDPDPFKTRKASYIGPAKYPEPMLLNLCLKIDERVEKAYKLCHEFLTTYDHIKFKDSLAFLQTTISRFYASENEYFIEVAKTFQNWMKEISNSFIKFKNGFRLSNGPIEGTNNIVKILKRVSFGFTNFDHQRARIMVYFDK